VKLTQRDAEILGQQTAGDGIVPLRRAEQLVQVVPLGGHTDHGNLVHVVEAHAVLVGHGRVPTCLPVLLALPLTTRRLDEVFEAGGRGRVIGDVLVRARSHLPEFLFGEDLGGRPTDTVEDAAVVPPHQQQSMNLARQGVVLSLGVVVVGGGTHGLYGPAAGVL
jgi:hypothetical protein